MFGKLGVPELLVIFAIVMIVFGPKQLPKLGETFGKTIRSFRSELDSDKEVEKDDENTETK